MADTASDPATKGARLRALGEAARATANGDPAFADLIAVGLLQLETERLADAQASPAAPRARER